MISHNPKPLSEYLLPVISIISYLVFVWLIACKHILHLLLPECSLFFFLPLFHQDPNPVHKVLSVFSFSPSLSSPAKLVRLICIVGFRVSVFSYLSLNIIYKKKKKKEFEDFIFLYATNYERRFLTEVGQPLLCCFPSF